MEGHLSHLKGFEKAVVDLAVPLFAGDGEACVHQRIEVAVNGSANAAEFFGKIVETRPRGDFARDAASRAIVVQAGHRASQGNVTGPSVCR